MKCDLTYGNEIHMLSNLIGRKFKSMDSKRNTDNLTRAHGRVIDYIYSKGNEDVFQKDIEAEFSIRRSTATGILNLMEKNGLIKREAVSYDARLKKLVLLPKALLLHSNIEEVVAKLEALLIQNISEQDLVTFMKVIMQMKQNIY